MNNKIWVYKNVDSKITKDLVNRYGFDELCASVLQNRTEIVGGNIDNLFKRLLHNLHNPFLLNDMDKAVTRIEKAIMRNEKITIFGDYDADGVTSTAVLYMFLKENGADVNYFLPNRFVDGYGMNKDAVKKIFDDGTNLIITVDNGIAATEEVSYAMSLGMDVIVTDHHECPKNIPKCCAVINPKREDSTYPFCELSGVGVVFKLITALNKGTLESIIKKYILITAIGTIADVVPLNDENRAIVSMGLKMVPFCNNVGLNSLFDVSALKCDENIGVSDFSFGIVPRINAAGRLDDASICVELITSCDKTRCDEISGFLDSLNRNRQEIEKEITEKAFEIIDSEKLYKDNVIVVCGNGWNHGVIGIVASKITDKFYKPCIVLTDDVNGFKGSGRSISGFDLYNSLCYCSDILEKFGGHSQAAGLSLSENNIEKFREKINEYAKNNSDENTFVQKIYIDAILKPENLNLDCIDKIKILEPYGAGNPKPVFALLDSKVIKKQCLSDGKHIKLRVKSGACEIDVIGFSMGDFYGLIEEGDTVDLAGNLDINEYRGFLKPQIVLKDIKRIRKM